MAILASVALFLLQCGSLERNHPADPYNARREEGSTLSLRLPLPKALVRVVHRIEAMLEGPDMLPVTKELDLSPLGPATGTMGAIPPGIGRTLTLKGFDLDGNLLFEGRQSNITISIGDTTSVVINLTLVQAPIDVEPEIPDGGEPTGEPGDGEPTGEPGDGEPTGEPGDGEPTGESGDGEPTGEPGDEEPTGEPGDGEPTGEPGDEEPTGEPGGEPTGEPGDEEPTGEPGGESTG